MFNLPIHAPHHADTSEGGHTLATNGPVLPAGYLVMLWLPLLPAIWRRVMDHRSELWPEDMQKEIRS
jgi:alkane 1-monooxygenase